MTSLLGAWLGPIGGELVVVEPSPSAALRDSLSRSAAQTRLVVGASPWALDQVGAAELWLIDGDHNYWTVLRELRAVRAAGGAESRPYVVIAHDVGWPAGRRDQYYLPSSLPDSALRRHDPRRGVKLGDPLAADGGFRGEGAFAFADEEGGPENGVLTAIEDFMAEAPGHDLYVVPAVFGLGVLVPGDHPERTALSHIFGPLHDDPLLASLERNRLANYLRVIELQDEASSRERERAIDRDLAASELRAARDARRDAETRVAALEAENRSLREAQAQIPQFDRLVELARRLRARHRTR